LTFEEVERALATWIYLSSTTRVASWHSTFEERVHESASVWPVFSYMSMEAQTMVKSYPVYSGHRASAEEETLFRELDNPISDRGGIWA